MSDRSGIEWTDATWNPVTGCTEVSPGCDHCYAKTFAERWRGKEGHYYASGFDVQLRPEKLDQPLRWRRPRRIFVNSMSDLFHDDVPSDFIAKVFAIMALAPQHTFQVLTKRHGRMRSLLNSDDFEAEIVGHAVWFADHWYGWPEGKRVLLDFPLGNVWLGVSTENQQWANIRIPALLDTPAAVRFVSAEPLLGPISIFARSSIDRDPGIDWVIVGGESGHGARPMYPGWVRSLRDECQRAGTAFLFKQWGEWGPSRGGSRLQCLVWSDGAFREFDHQPGLFETGIPLTPPGWCNSERVGKKAAGRELDGRTWDEYPEEVRA